MTDIEKSPLGRDVAYPDAIDADMLFPIPREKQREALGISASLPFHGEDAWTAFELSWLDRRGKPHVAIATLHVPADSPAIIESKSLKLYLGGYANVRFEDAASVSERIRTDLSRCCGQTIRIQMFADASIDQFAIRPLTGICLDDADIDIDSQVHPSPELLSSPGMVVVEETLFSRLFRSNCPVTGQPDWADVEIRYRGASIDRIGLLRYLVSYRQHRDFHEQCVERMFLDIKQRCRPEVLTVHARFTRRGGLDINPWRSDDPHATPPSTMRTTRQ